MGMIAIASWMYVTSSRESPMKPSTRDSVMPKAKNAATMPPKMSE